MEREGEGEGDEEGEGTKERERERGMRRGRVLWVLRDNLCLAFEGWGRYPSCDLSEKIEIKMFVCVRSFLPPRAPRPRNIGTYVFTATRKNLYKYNRDFC